MNTVVWRLSYLLREKKENTLSIKKKNNENATLTKIKKAHQDLDQETKKQV